MCVFLCEQEKPAPSDFPEGGIPLARCDVTSGDIQCNKNNCIRIITDDRVYFLCAGSDVDKKAWIKALTTVAEKLSPQTRVDFSKMKQQPPPQRGGAAGAGAGGAGAGAGMGRGGGDEKDDDSD